VTQRLGLPNMVIGCYGIFHPNNHAKRGGWTNWGDGLGASSDICGSSDGVSAMGREGLEESWGGWLYRVSAGYPLEASENGWGDGSDYEYG
jgi:hypothetical protein